MDTNLLLILAGAALLLAVILRSKQDQTAKRPGIQTSETSGAKLEKSELKKSLLRLVQENKTIEAIKLLKNQQNLGLKEAKELIDELKATGNLASKAESRPLIQNSDTGMSHLQIAAKDQLELAQLIRDGQKITAIKILREKTGLGLAEAKELVEKIEKTQ